MLLNKFCLCANESLKPLLKWCSGKWRVVSVAIIFINHMDSSME